MTIVFTAAAENMISMTADSAITLDFVDAPREYSTGMKSYAMPGVGCVTTWGDQTLNHVGRFLNQWDITPATHSVLDLSLLVKEYLKNEFRPHELGCEVGYHIAGFDRTGHPRLFHVFYGFDRPRPPEQKEMKYEYYIHSPMPGAVQFLYNGREDLAWVVVTAFLEQLRAGNAVHPRFAGLSGLITLGDFVSRFAAELTPEVGPPFVTRIINPNNEIVTLRNDQLCPIGEKQIRETLHQLGCQGF